MPKDFMPDYAMKALAWEDAKGKLRGVVALQGSYVNGTNFEQYNDLNKRVEDFIKDVEHHALQE